MIKQLERVHTAVTYGNVERVEIERVTHKAQNALERDVHLLKLRLYCGEKVEEATIFGNKKLPEIVDMGGPE